MAFLEEYTLLDELGQGGYATVYKVRHNKLGYIRAIRVLNAIIAHGEEDKTYQKFLEECRLLLRLGNGNHPNIVHIYQPLLKEQRAIVEMDFVDGKDLYHYLESNHSFVEIKDVMRLLTDIGSALAYCHEDIYKFCMDKDEDNLQDDPEDGSKVLLDEETKERLIEKYRVIHNDIHSCNIIRREDGTYVLLDFGLAIESGSVVRSSRRKNGAPEFKSPEKWDNESILTTQSDIYSFGVVLYEYLAGRVPFVFDKSKSNPAEAEYLLGEAHKKQEPTPIYELRKTAFENAHPGETYKKDYPDWLEALIMKCLSKSINERFKNGKELYDYVLAHIGNEYDAQIESLTQEIKAKEVVIKELANSLAKAQIETQEIKAELEKIKKENRILSDKLQEANQATDIIISIHNPVKGIPQEWVDLGLPSGTKWATCNVGASSQEDFGNYYAWGETTPKSEYTESNSVTYGKSTTALRKSNVIDTFGNLTMQNDAARQNWGGDWRMPTSEEFEELKVTCTWRWTTKNEIDGYEVIGPNGNSIFLPDTRHNFGIGEYWSSSRNYSGNGRAYSLNMIESVDIDNPSHPVLFDIDRWHGLTIRPVIGSSTPKQQTPESPASESKKPTPEPDNDGRDEKGGVKWQVVLIIITILILLCLGLFVKNSNNINTPPVEACNDTIAACNDTLAVIEPVVEVEVNGVKFKMIYVEGGTFTMGATSEQGSDYESNELPTHKVTLSDYYIGETEVTQELWEAVMGNNPSYHTGNPHYPVEKVSWEDCQEFIQELNRLTGKRFRLPTEAEWEFAARGGNSSIGYKYSGSNRIDDVAWYGGDTKGMTHQVGTKSPNELGIYDMSGNVWEMCSDWYGDYSSSSQTAPSGPATGSYRVFRGGCCINPAASCRVSCRAVGSPDSRSWTSGFRLVCDNP